MVMHFIMVLRSYTGSQGWQNEDAKIVARQK
jgi:hypothetical protein